LEGDVILTHGYSYTLESFFKVHNSLLNLRLLLLDQKDREKH
jgi:translation initiation factor 2B subunit (eIF-2B alpha/beta/delta family)